MRTVALVLYAVLAGVGLSFYVAALSVGVQAHAPARKNMPCGCGSPVCSAPCVSCCGPRGLTDCFPPPPADPAAIATNHTGGPR